MLTASNVNGTYSFSYDPDGRVTQVSEPFGQTLNYAYDGDGNQTQVVDSFGGTETSVYDLQDRLVTREYTGEGENLRVDFTYTANNQIATETDYYNLAGTDLVGSTTYAYDADQNVTSIVSYNASSSVIESFAYTYDRAGNLSSETDTQQGTPTTTTYSYDDANQLTGAGGTDYSYDANGNRTMTGYTTGAGNELTSDGTYDYTYDASGQEITKTDIATGDKWTYEYNSGGELTSAEEQTSLGAIENQISYEYDIFGQLIQEDANGTITEYAVDGWNPAKAGATGNSNFDVWATFTSGGSLITRQIQGDGIDQHLAYVTSSNAYWYLTDHLGSTRATINNSGTVQDSIVYDAYGNITSQSNASAAPLYTYTGRELDVETGLQYNRARWYDPGTGRWITQDPMGFDAGDSNLYRYVNNAPTDAADPSGFKPANVVIGRRYSTALLNAGQTISFGSESDQDSAILFIQTFTVSYRVLVRQQTSNKRRHRLATAIALVGKISGPCRGGRFLVRACHVRLAF